MKLLAAITVLWAAAQMGPPRIADPCTLLTQAEASALIGQKLNPGVMKRFGIITRCTFFNPNQSNSEQYLILDVHNETAPAPDATLFDSETHMPDVSRVPGVGDQALWSHSQIGSSLDILKGGKMVSVGLPRTITSVTPAVLQAGKLIASRM